MLLNTTQNRRKAVFVFMGIGKAAVIAEHKKRAEECRKALAKMKADDPRRKTVERNLQLNEECIKFLADPSTPEL